MKEKSRSGPDIFDALFAMNRQRIILEMINNGQLDADSGMRLYESTTSPEIVEKDREAFEKGDFGPNSPSGILGTLYSKLAPKKP